MNAFALAKCFIALDFLYLLMFYLLEQGGIRCIWCGIFIKSLSLRVFPECAAISQCLSHLLRTQSCNSLIVDSQRIFEHRNLIRVMFGCNMKLDMTVNNGSTFTDVMLFLFALTSRIRQWNADVRSKHKVLGSRVKKRHFSKNMQTFFKRSLLCSTKLHLVKQSIVILWNINTI